MISDYLEIIGSYISNSSKIPIEEIKNKSKHLGIKLPEQLVEFYSFFGNGEEVLKSFYEFIKVEEFSIYNDALLFCYGHQRESLIGILLDDTISNDDPPVNKTLTGRGKWYFESNSASNFFVNMACWQVVNALPSLAKANVEEDVFRNTIIKYLNPISQDKSIFLGYDLLSYFNKEKNILACYLRETEELYVASSDDSFLKAFEEESTFELDWL